MNFWQKARRTLIGDRAFYRALLAIIIPVIVQNAITNFVSLLDNLMVGALGTNEMSGVAVANQLIFIFNLCIFGGLSGPGIYTAQFSGSGDMEGIRNSFRFKIAEVILLSTAAISVLLLMGDRIIGLFLTGEASGAAEDPAMILQYARSYLSIIMVGLPVYALAQSYASTLRETGDAFWPMVASVSAVITNLAGNWLLIFGNLGCPRMGVEGAALATVISRFVELGIVGLRAHLHTARYPFIKGLYRTLRIPAKLFKKICITGAPLLVNEAIWSTGISTLTVIYSTCGLTVVGALSIQSTIANLFSSFAYSTGTAVAVMVGQSLGAGLFEKAKAQVWQIIAFSEMMALVIGSILMATAGLIPQAYTQVDANVRALASSLLRVSAIALPIHVFAHGSYFTLRSGGKTVITFLFDCVYTWVVSVPLAFLLVRIVGLNIVTAYLLVELAELSKCLLGYILIRKGIWIRRITT